MSLSNPIRSMKRRAQHFGAAFMFSLLTFSSAHAVPVADSPLFVLPPVPPALLLAVDDSGSMDGEILMRANDGAAWWHTGDESFTGRNQSDAVEAGVINFNIGGGANRTWKKFTYLFPNGTGITDGRRQYADNNNDHYAVPPIGQFAYVRSPEYNFSYFDPATTYDPWPDLGSYTFANQDPTNAQTDPVRGTARFNLTVDRRERANNHVFRGFDGMVIPAGTVMWNGVDWVPTPADETIAAGDDDSGGIGLPISYFPATFFLPESTPLPAGYGYDPARMPGGADVVIDGQGPDGTPLVRYEIRPHHFVTPEAYDAAIQNFANWFTYYRKRHLASRGAIGVAFQDLNAFRVGSYRINNRINVPMRDLSVGSERDAFFNEVYFDYLGTGGTPNKQAVNHMRGQFARTGTSAPILESCQLNFGVLFTDGYSNPWNPGVGNRDGIMGSPFADGVSNTMADIAAALYLDNPRPDLPTGEVPLAAACSGDDPHPSLDCNPDLHVNLYAVTLGAPGTVFRIDEAATEDPYANPPTWPTSFPQRNPTNVDDLWHATLNGRGVMLDVNVPAQLGVRFAEILAAIGARLDTSATSAATSSAVLQTDTLLYTAGFRSGDWSGRLDARNVKDDGTLGGFAWDAEERLVLKGHAARNIVTVKDSTGEGVPFLFSNLSATQQDALSHDTGNVNDGLGSARVDWLRGKESTTFRDRSNSGSPRLLGDIVNSNPKFEAGVLYVGANDGMLHAFDAETGDELFAYVPSELLAPEPGNDFSPLVRLTDPNYTHRYYVDGTVTVADLSIYGIDQTVLVGGMGAGGRTVFALDVTEPGSFDAGDIMWEFTHPELGENVGPPAIVRMKDGTLAAVFGNGYNGASDRAMLFIVNLETGSLIQVIDTPHAGPNGLAAPAVTDWPASNLVANRIYAGDLEGNLWRFDVSGEPSTWATSVTSIFTATDAGGIRQPITTSPVVALNPANSAEVVVSFGTGSYFRTTDQGMTQVQSLYGVLDTVSGVSGVTRTQLLEQTIDSQSVETFGGEVVNVRVVSENPIDPLVHKGWRLDLDQEAGERVITDATFPTGPLQRRVRFSTLIPDENPCGSGRRGFLIDVDLITGGRTDFSVFDLNRDGLYDGDDMTTDGPVSGVEWGQGERPTVLTPADSSGDPPEFLYTGEGEFIKGLGEEGLGGRQSWQQLR
ncbi:PilC/PilY family type IV pilus protein [Wenzhouxiangella sp. XN24]|uniref:pilus assembly protein n=1 Tax=Wenzhouxiangella sp. XN24 TaxID=2713569 RepID=UPI0013EBC956|nr:PilC/PilY family type IV pilus protein [Wenzhouxiangella sp. XN24]NGX16675.1 hypothetical protein [Wenzhouxiangella sp. XN24]